ncbi:hypothetical protein CAPTEDRAFT_184989 [Capitella teleta]|uniref:G-protein coupled receptors family 1 profile domain-containing protein n=1 Tax=Capitella teleta TaxID=283909 RepID=R7T5S1_CAPTE|nr:hypothetical protein CAPTEDRAFT_184989 [Capitella teleta]|eukprot:ELT88548.1 hypothetical protein CAPTEDRAFT_184989 [Capitella teleta]
MSVFIIISCVVVLAVVFGFLGNACTVYLVLRHRSLWRWMNIFHVSLSFADCISLSTTLPGLLVLTWPGQLDSTELRVGCALFAFSGITCNVISITQLTEISVIRFFRIIRPKHHTHDCIYAVCLVAPWLLGISSALISFRTSFILTSLPGTCLSVTASWMKHPGVYTIITISYSSVVIVASAYTLIVLHLWQMLNQRVQPEPAPRPQGSTPALKRNQEATLVSIILVATFALSYLPCPTLLLVHRTLGTVPAEEAIIATFLCAQLSSVWNPYLYALRKRAFRRKFIRVLRSLTCSK